MLAAGAALKFAEKNPELVKTAAGVAMEAANDPKVKKAALTALSNGGGSVGGLNKLVSAAVRKK